MSLRFGSVASKPVRRAPDAGDADVLSGADLVRPDPHRPASVLRAKGLDPFPGMRPIDRDQDRLAAHCDTTPAGAVSRLKAAASSARV